MWTSRQRWAWLGLLLVMGFGINGCAKTSKTEWPTLKPPFEEVIPKTGVFQYDPSSGTAEADPEIGKLTCVARVPAGSGQRQTAKAEMVIDDAIYFTQPQTVSLSAMISVEWKVVGFQPRDLTWVQAEVRLEDMNDPEQAHALVVVRQLLTLKGQASGNKHLFNVQTTVPLEAGKRYRARFLAQTEVRTNSASFHLGPDEWKTLTEKTEEVLTAGQVQPLDAEALMHQENRADVQCTLHFFKMR